MRVYVHGAGRSGRDAWPHASRDDATFLGFPPFSSLRDKIDQLTAVTSPDAVVIAHSAGAIPAVLAVAQDPMSVVALVLVEPALYDIARGTPPIERHIDAMTSARRRADTGDLFGFWSVVRPIMFGGPADPASWASEREVASRLASFELPWGHDVTAHMVARTQTLVITGGWNDEYEAVASALVDAGASHVQLIGNEHRPQDHPDFERTVQEWLTR